MIRSWTLACVLGLAVSQVTYGDDKPAEKPAEAPAGETKPAAEEGPYKTVEEKASYAIGLNIGSGLLGQGFDAEELGVDVNIIAEGIKDALTKAKPRISEEQIQAAMQEFSKQMEARQPEIEAKRQEKQAAMEAKRKEEGDKARKEGEAFLAANAKEKGVKATDSGLQYQVIKEGDGAKPKASDTVTVHYKGTLVNGEEFDSSYKRGEPATFPLADVIPGWTEGLQLMPVGSKYKLVIPQELGYGPRGGGAKIPPYSVLVFEVELLGIEK